MRNVHRIRLALTIGSIWIAFVLTGCPSTPKRQIFDYQRRANLFKIDTVTADHPYCSQGNTPFASVDECKKTRKYKISWTPPADTQAFVEYRVYVDTTPPTAPNKKWAEVRANREYASLVIPGIGGVKSDSVIFVVHHGIQPLQSLQRKPQIALLDTTGRVNSSGRLVFAITTSYQQAGIAGEPQYSEIVTYDAFSPESITPLYQALQRTVEIDWTRPGDATNFFDPGADSGIIREYVLRIKRGGIYNRLKPGVFAPALRYLCGGVNRSAEVTKESTTVDGVPGWKFRLPDSQRVTFKRVESARDSIHVTVMGLSPQDTVDISVWAVDSSGNFTDPAFSNRLILTDSTQPMVSKLRVVTGSITRNRFIYAFTASRDSISDSVGTGLIPGPTPNFRIQEYRLSRNSLSGKGAEVGSKDSILVVNKDNRADSVFTDTVRFLPPGSKYRIYLQAMDSSGFFSPKDSLDVTTDSIRFTGADSGLNCLPGFVPLPSARFILGDTSAKADVDEKPAKQRVMGSYCIEVQEHRDSSGGFTRRATWEQAYKICNALSPTDGTHLCTEVEWERACETGDSLHLNYGMQSENGKASPFFETCNVNTGDMSMAYSAALRNPACLTTEGVFDLPGNLAEWVADVYSAQAYTLTTQDSLVPAIPFTPANDSGLHSIRGYHFAKGDGNPLSDEIVLKQSRCSDRKIPTAIRPRAFPGCIDSANPMIVVTYNKPLTPYRCLTLPDSLQSETIISVTPLRDSTQLSLLLADVAKPIILKIPADTAFTKFRPVDGKMTPLALAIVTMVNADNGLSLLDTLDAAPLLQDTSQLALEKQFAHEVALPWSVKKVGGKFEIRFVYAHAQKTVQVAAKRFYSNDVLGFRCCSLPKP